MLLAKQRMRFHKSKIYSKHPAAQVSLVGMEYCVIYAIVRCAFSDICTKGTVSLL